MAARFMVGGRSTDTAATIDEMASHLWNPHSAMSIYCVEAWVFLVGATATNGQLIRTTTIGTTPSSSVNPDIDNHLARRFTDTSGVTLELGNFATEPTVAGPSMARFNMPAASGAGFMFVFPVPVEIPAGTGFGIGTPTAVVFQDSDHTYVWEE